MRMATFRDIAKLANVSVATVSRAFSRKNYVSEETRQIVYDAAKKLNYNPNPSSRTQKRGFLRVVGLIIPRISNPFYIQLAQYLEKAFRANGYQLIIRFLSENTSHEDENAALKMMLDMRACGVIFSPHNSDHQEIVQKLLDHDICVLQLLTKAYENTDAIVMDDNYGMYIGTRHLFNIGHKKILFAGNRERMDGVYRAYGESQIKCPEELIYTYGRRESLTDATNKIRNMIQSYHPTAVFAVTDFIGVAVFNALKALSIRFPEDVSFLMYDDQTWTSMLDISVITHPMETIADLAVHRIINSITSNAPSPPVTSSVQPYLLLRSSTQPLQKSSS